MVTEDEIIDDVRAFLLTFLPIGAEVVRGQTNRVPECASDNFVVLTPLWRGRLSTNVTAYTPTTAERSQAAQLVLQFDVHGPLGSDWANIISTLWRSEYACDTLTTCQPLYCNDGRQVPFVNGEAQYEDRWVLEANLQANLVVSTPQQFADTLQAQVKPPVDGGAFIP